MFKFRLSNILLSLLSCFVALTVLFVAWIAVQEEGQERLLRHYLHENAKGIRCEQDTAWSSDALSDALADNTWLLRLTEDGYTIFAIRGSTDFHLTQGQQITQNQMLAGKNTLLQGVQAATLEPYRQGTLGLDVHSALDTYAIQTDWGQGLPAGEYVIDGIGNCEHALQNLLRLDPDAFSPMPVQALSSLRVPEVLNNTQLIRLSVSLMAALGFLFGLSYWIELRMREFGVLQLFGVPRLQGIRSVSARGVALIFVGAGIGFLIWHLFFPHTLWKLYAWATAAIVALQLSLIGAVSSKERSVKLGGLCA